MENIMCILIRALYQDPNDKEALEEVKRRYGDNAVKEIYQHIVVGDKHGPCEKCLNRFIPGHWVKGPEAQTHDVLAKMLRIIMSIEKK